MQGENVVVLAYGASATGKSYTLQARTAVAAAISNTTAASMGSRAGRKLYVWMAAAYSIASGSRVSI
jgi:hypothetical protein